MSKAPNIITEPRLVDAPKNAGEAFADALDKFITLYGTNVAKGGLPWTPEIIADGFLHIFENLIALKPELGVQIIEAIRRQQFKISLMRGDAEQFVKNFS